MLDDITLRLRQWAEDNGHSMQADMYREAADEIEKLRAKLYAEQARFMRAAEAAPQPSVE